MRKNLDLSDDFCNKVQASADQDKRSFTKQLEILASEALTNRKTK